MLTDTGDLKVTTLGRFEDRLFQYSCTCGGSGLFNCFLVVTIMDSRLRDENDGAKSSELRLLVTRQNEQAQTKKNIIVQRVSSWRT